MNAKGLDNGSYSLAMFRSLNGLIMDASLLSDAKVCCIN